jgi:ferredoxin
MSDLDDQWLELLPVQSADGRARHSALSAATSTTQTPTSLVAYISAGYVLIIGDIERALSVAQTLARQDDLEVVVYTPVFGRKVELAHQNGIIHLHGSAANVTGHLGQFHVNVNENGTSKNIANLAGIGQDYFDIVLDLGTTPALKVDIPPPGYFAPGWNSNALSDALAQIPDLVGEFEKPKYFNFNPDICAHGNSGLTGCTRCIKSCSTLAITSLGDSIEVNPHLCQGLGTCATVCPSGAMSYAYPLFSDLLDNVRRILCIYQETGGKNPVLLFHDGEAGRKQLTPLTDVLPEYVIPIEVESIATIGLDACLAALAYGAQYVVILATESTTVLTRNALQTQLSFGVALLKGMGNRTDQLILVKSDDTQPLVSKLAGLVPIPALKPATFAAFNEKRTTLFLSLDHLYQQVATASSVIELPEGAPFGEIQVDQAACTMCMACVSVCPSGALEAGDDKPQLSFIESKCVQCGLCDIACPENAIHLSPRFVFDADARQNRRTLNEEQPFHCVVCGVPFASQSVIKNMHEKLSDHWMFQTEQARRRLEMCEDCRVKDMFDHNGVVDEHKKPDLH